MDVKHLNSKKMMHTGNLPVKTAIHGLYNSRLFLILLAFGLIAAILLPSAAYAQNAGNVIRVGWYESPFNSTDEFGRRSGYAYDYQQKIASYTGWTYEYVQGSWPDLLQMLMDGKIDLLSDVSYTEERTENMLFSTLPMGTEEYYIFISPDNKEIKEDDFSTFNGKKVGINKNSVQVVFFRDWAEENGVEAEIVELTCTVDESIEMLNKGNLDMLVTMDIYFDINKCLPVTKVGGSDFFFAVSKSRPEILPELNFAMSRIQNENINFNRDLYSKYLKVKGSNLYLTANEKDWLEAHGTIRVGYQDNYMAFCAQDPQTGELTGALKDFLRVAADSLEDVHLDFEPVVFPSAAAAMEALKNGDVDCMFPANLSPYDGETQGFSMTPAMMRTDMSAVIRKSDANLFASKDRVRVAVNAGNPNYDKFLQEYFPDWLPVYFKDTPEGLKAIANDQADCLVFSFYRYNDIASLCEKYDLTLISTGVTLDYEFAVNRQDTELYSILSKVTGLVPAAAVNSALSYYYTQDSKESLVDLLQKNLGIVIAVPTVIAAVILILLIRSSLIEKRERSKQLLISATEFDKLTELYSKSFFYQYAERMYREDPDKPMDAVFLDIEQLHSVNAINGHVFGDMVLRELGAAIKDFLLDTYGIAGRGESDHFAVYCSHMEDCHPLLERLQSRLARFSVNANIHLRMGVMPWQPGMGPVEMFENARIACSKARGKLTSPLVIFDEKIRDREAFEHRLLNDLNRAVENREFEVFYQPKFDIQTDPPKLMSAEVLVRWRHPEFGLISPGEFIPLLEQNSQISIVDRFVWEEAARQVSAWKEKYGITVPVSVNLSRVDIFDLSLESTLDKLLLQYKLDHSDLKLEVTESACTENADEILDVIERLRKKGFEIEMDDFGTGYSSLSMLSSMPVDVLKMDSSFVSNIEENQKDLHLVEMILGIANDLQVPVIAEGVETETQYKLLKEMGCELVQGYYFSRPLPAVDFEKNIIEETLV